MRLIAICFGMSFLFAASSFAHFVAIIPSNDIVTQVDPLRLQLQIKFIHPLEQQYLEMVKPKAFGVFAQGESWDLLATLQPAKSKKPRHRVTSCTVW